jgi:hypothetical protein
VGCEWVGGGGLLVEFYSMTGKNKGKDENKNKKSTSRGNPNLFASA